MISTHSWSTFFWAFIFLPSLIASLHAILRRREHRAVTWWILFSWFLPLIGPALYIFFGINRIERKAARLRPRDPKEQAIKPGPDPRLAVDHLLPSNAKHLTSFSHLVDGVVGMPLLNGNKITLLRNGDEAYPAMIEAINHAQESISLATYIFNHDKAGKMFVEALSKAANRKVQIRVLIDDVGSGLAWRTIYQDLKRNKIPVAYFLPSFAPWRMTYLNLRNHRKILTVDGRIGFTGGMNIHESNLLNSKPKHPCQDLHFKIEGPVVAHIQSMFQLDWYFTTGEYVSGAEWFPDLKNKGTALARGIPDGPDEDFEKCQWVALGALAHARKSVQIITPYLIPDMATITALNLAAMSGINVQILLPDTSDMSLVTWACRSMLWRILEKGCRVYLSPSPFDHSKLMIVDGVWTLFGSTNWDYRSFRLNFEFNMECYDKDLAEKLERLFDEKISASREITLTDVDGRSIPTRLRDGIARLFAPIL